MQEAQGDYNDKDSVASEENDFKIIDVLEAFSRSDELLD
jgi:hypothetical protein